MLHNCSIIKQLTISPSTYENSTQIGRDCCQVTDFEIIFQQNSVLWKLLLRVHKEALNWIFLSYWCLKKQNAHTKVKYDYLPMFSGQIYYKWKIWSKWVHTTVLLHLCTCIFPKCICMIQALTFKIVLYSLREI